MTADAAMRRPAQSEKHPRLDRPPLVEVVCGFIFDSVPQLDLAELGVYWDGRRREYPLKDIQPTLFDGPTFHFGASAIPARLVLTSVDSSRVLQLQHDRFFMNWRAAGNDYPSFSGHDNQPGLGDEAVSEFAKFSKFVRERLGKNMEDQLRWVELTKIDFLVRGPDWSDLSDLAKLLPITGTFQSIHRSDARELNLRFTEQGDKDQLAVSLTNGIVGNEPAIRLESRTRIAITGAETPRESMTRANDMINEVFFKLVPVEELKRFNAATGGK